MNTDSDIYRLLTRTTRVGLALALAVLVVVAREAEPWRLGALGLMLALLLVPEGLRLRGREPSWPVFAVLVPTCQLVIVVATGGIHSPLVVIFIPIAVIAGYAVGERSRLLVAAEVLLILALFAFDASPWRPEGFVPAAFGGLRPPLGRSIWVAVLILAMVMGNRVSRGARAALAAEQRRVLETQRVAIAAMDRQQADLVALSGAIAHALKNPLTAVMSLASYHHRRAPERSDQRAELEVMLSEMERMRTSLAELLNLSRPADALALEPLDLARPAAEVLTAHGALADEAGVTLAGPFGAARARVDGRKLVQVLSNLVQNAVQAGRPGGRVEVHLSEVGDDARVEVRDDGPGLPPELAGRVFEPGVTSRREGTGIGLTICRALVEQHGGRIGIEPAAVGTRVVFTVPRGGPQTDEEAP